MVHFRHRWPLLGLSGVCIFVLALAAVLARPSSTTALAQTTQPRIYAVKFVCGAVREWPEGGEPPVKVGNYATEINIFNSSPTSALIRKRVNLLVLRGDPRGREPKQVGTAAFDSITLAPNNATMDDCNRIWRLLNPNAPLPPPTPLPLMIGYLTLISTNGVDLNVDAVYTAGALDPASNTPVSIDVERISSK